MNLGDINKRITFFSGVGTSEFDNTDRLIAINQAIDSISIMIINSIMGHEFDDVSIGDLAQWPKSYNLVADTQVIDLDFVTNQILRIKRVEINYTGTTDGWRKMTPFNQHERSDSIDTTRVNEDFDVDKSFYSIVGETLKTFPIPTANRTNGLRVYFTRSMTVYSSGDLTTGTVIPGFDRQFHDFIAILVALDYAIAKSKKNANSLQTKATEFELRIKQHYGSKDEDRNMQLKSKYISYR